MAFGFIKKIFSFGKKTVEEQPADEAEALPPPEATVAEPAPAPAPEPKPTAEPPSAPKVEAKVPSEPAPAKKAEPEPEPEKPVKAKASVKKPAKAKPESKTKPESKAKPEKPAPEPAEDIVTKPEQPAPALENQVPSEPAPVVHEEPVAETRPLEKPPVAPPVPDHRDLPPAEALDDAPAETPDLDAQVPSAPTTRPIPDDKPDETPKVPKPPKEPSAPAAGRGGSVTIGDEPKVPAPLAEAEPEKKSWLKRLTSGLSRSSRQLTESIAGVFTKRKLDDDTLQDLEDILIQADLGIETAMRITDTLSSGRYGREVSTEEVRSVMAGEITKVLGPVAQPLELDLSHRPHVILVVGVNGTGKTTTIGKLAAKLRDAGLGVTLGAGDTFRAAAIEQLKIWADRTGSQFVGTKLGADAAGLAYAAYETARDNGSDVVIIDTAGRLQNKTELMDELAKIVRVLGKLDPEAPHTVLQTLDATTGQNALNQVDIFRNVAGVNGLVMTKLDGTARGGILVAIAAKFKLPVYFIGVGEQVDDLEPFRAEDFALAIAGSAEGDD